MTQRSEGGQRWRELVTGLMARVAGRAMSKRRTGLDGLAKSLLERRAKGPLAPDPELDHPDEWDRPID